MHAHRTLSAAVLTLSLAAFTGCSNNPVSPLGGVDANAPGAPTDPAAQTRGSDAGIDPGIMRPIMRP